MMKSNVADMEKVLSTKIEKWPGSDDTPEGMEYWMVTTLDDKGNEAVTGGMMKRQMPNSKELQTFLT